MERLLVMLTKDGKGRKGREGKEGFCFSRLYSTCCWLLVSNDFFPFPLLLKMLVLGFMDEDDF